MARQTYVLRDGKLVPKHLTAPPQSGAFHVISDTMDATWHPCTGQLMDSKSQFRRVTRAHDCYEVGNDRQGNSRPAYDSNALKRDIADSIRNPGFRPTMSRAEFESLTRD